MSAAVAQPTLGRRLIRGGLFALMGKALALPLGLATTMLLARLLEPAALGAYFLAMSLIGLLAILAQVGLARPMVKLVAAARATGRPAAARHAVGIAITTTFLGSIALALVLLLGPGALLAGALAGGQRLGDVLPLIALAAFAFALIDLAAETLRGLHDLGPASLLTDSLSQRLLATVAFALIFAVAGTLRLEGALLVMAIAACLVAIFACWLVWRRLRTLKPEGARFSTREILAHGPPFLFVRINLWLLGGADLWALGFCRPGEEVALYGAAARLAVLVGVPLLICNAVVAPVIAELHARGDAANLERSARAGATLGFIPTLAAALLFWLFGGPLLGALLGETYRAAAPLLTILLVGQVVRVACGSCAITLTMTGHQRDVMTIGIVVSLLTVLALALAAPAYGATGVALVATGSIVLHNLAMTLAVRRRLGVVTLPTVAPARLVELMGSVQRSLKRA